MRRMRQAERSFRAQGGSVALARQFVSTTLAEWGLEGLDWEAVAAVSELTTNAVLHARTDFTVTVTSDDEELCVTVHDASALRPRPRHHSEVATTGRGLLLVEALAESWGVDLDEDGRGKNVWCRFTTAAGRRAGTSDEARNAAASGDADEILARFADPDDGSAALRLAAVRPAVRWAA